MTDIAAQMARSAFTRRKRQSIVRRRRGTWRAAQKQQPITFRTLRRNFAIGTVESAAATYQRERERVTAGKVSVVGGCRYLILLKQQKPVHRREH